MPNAEETAIRVLVVDDDRTQAEMLKNLLDLEGFSVRSRHSAAEALEALAVEKADIVVSDFRMPGMNGLEFFNELKRRGPLPIFIIVTAFGTLEGAVDAMRAGVHDFVSKPVDVGLLALRIRNAMRVQSLEAENSVLRDAVAALRHDIKIVGDSEKTHQLLQTVARVAGSHATILIHGESGTGKEMVARALHIGSPRQRGPYIKVNCAAIPENLLEAELFGHKKGAFTGAIADRPGRFALAHKGTIFLDEIGEMPLHLQPKLLRVLQEREIEPVGSGASVPIDVRVVVATHRDLREMVREGRFREDLFYRLNVIPLQIAPLRERKDDILPLAQHFLRRFAEENGRALRGFTQKAEQRLQYYSWPGNVRELENCVERAVVLARKDEIGAEDLALDPPSPTAAALTTPVLDALFEGQTTLERIEHDLIVGALSRCDGNLSRAARTLGLTRRTLQYRVEKMRHDAAPLGGPLERPDGS